MSKGVRKSCPRCGYVKPRQAFPRPTKSASGYRGVKKQPDENGFNAQYKRIYLGYFSTAKDAARAYDIAAKADLGSFAILNFPDKETP